MSSAERRFFVRHEPDRERAVRKGCDAARQAGWQVLTVTRVIRHDGDDLEWEVVLAVTPKVAA